MADSEIYEAHTFDEGRSELEPYGWTCERWRPHLMERPDRHNELELNLLRSGTLTYLHRGKRVTLEPGRLTIFWALQPHQIVDFEGKEVYYVATIPFTTVLQWRMPPAFINEIMAGAMLQEGDEEVAKLDDTMFERWLRDVDSGSAKAKDAMQIEMEARLRRLALSYETVGNHDENESAGGPARTDGRMSQVERMAVFVATHYRQDIQVREIGEAVDLHPDYANVLFREALGVTLSDYLLEHRIAHAQRMLVTTDEKVASIAFASGFGSISRFNAAFKSASDSWLIRDRGAFQDCSTL